MATQQSQEGESKTYAGSCHCGANKFTVPISPPLSKESRVMSCNCSICSVNSYIFTFVSCDAMAWQNGGFSTLTSYKFNKEVYEHYFCPTCGTSLCVNLGGNIGLNIRTLEGVDIKDLNVGEYDGKSL